MEIAGIEPATLCMLSTRATNCAKPPSSVTGNRTPVSRVTGWDTSHYTMTEWNFMLGIRLNFEYALFLIFVTIECSY